MLPAGMLSPKALTAEAQRLYRERAFGREPLRDCIDISGTGIGKKSSPGMEKL